MAVALIHVAACSPGAQDAAHDPVDTLGTGVAVPLIVVEPDRDLGDPAHGPGPTGALNRALASVRGPARIQLLPGRYVLDPHPWIDPTCGNCEAPDQPVDATVGLEVGGTDLTLFGPHPDSVIIHTRAGYGVLFDECQGCVLRGVTVTGGERDADARATDGAIVVRNSSVTLQQCAVRDNLGDSSTVATTVVGVAGIVGREGGRIDVRSCSVERNSWDGIALYRGSDAHVRGNVIDGVDAGRGSSFGGGRGVGVGVTGNARAVVEENLIRRYWKGVGVFSDAHAEIRENVIEGMMAWGIALWSNGGTAVAFVEDNVVYQTGACGILVDLAGESAEPGLLARNLVVATGRDPRFDDGTPYCPQQPIARVDVPSRFAIRDNLFHGNRRPGPHGDVELNLDQLVAQAMNLYTFHIEPQPATKDSGFMEDFAEAFGPPFR